MAARNLVNLNDVAKGYGSRSVLDDVTLGISDGRPDRRRRAQRRRQVHAAAADRGAGGARRRGGDAAGGAAPGARSARATTSTRPRTVRDELVGGRADHEWAADAALPRASSTGCSAAWRSTRFPQGLDTPIAPLSGGERRRIALAAPAAGQPRAAAARRADQPPRRRGRRLAGPPPRGPPRLAGRRDARPLVPRRRLHARPGRSPTAPVHQLRGRLRGLRPGARRARPPGRRARGPPPAAAAQGAGLAAPRPAGAHLQAEVPHRGRQRADRRRAERRATASSCCASPPRGWATACSTPRTSRSPSADRALLRDAHLAARPGRPRGLVGVNGSGKTTLMQLLAGELAPDAGARRARRDRAPRAPLAGHRRDPGRPARARGARGGPRRGHAQRRPRRSPPRRSRERFGFRGDRAADARPRPLGRRAPAAAAHAAADGRAQRPPARRADQRPRHRHADRARGPARRLAGHARRGHPRPLLRRARLRRRLRADRRRRAPPPAGRHRPVPGAAPRGDRAGLRRRPRLPPRRPRPAPSARGAQGGRPDRARARQARRARDGAARGDGRGATDHDRLRELQAELAAPGGRARRARDGAGSRRRRRCPRRRAS